MDIVMSLQILSTERASSVHSANTYFYKHVKKTILVVFGVALFLCASLLAYDSK
jgi:hypothetical protein